MATEATAILNPAYFNAELRDAAPTKYIFTIAVARRNPELLNFIKLRAKSAFRNKVRSVFRWMPGVRKAKTAAELAVAPSSQPGERRLRASIEGDYSTFLGSCRRSPKGVFKRIRPKIFLLS